MTTEMEQSGLGQQGVFTLWAHWGRTGDHWNWTQILPAQGVKIEGPTADGGRIAIARAEFRRRPLGGHRAGQLLP